MSAAKTRPTIESDAHLAKHQAYHAMVDGALRDWEALNQHDARAVARLLATCETLGKGEEMSQIDLKDAKELLGWWTRAIQGADGVPGGPASATDISGCLFIGDVTLRHPITQEIIFANLQVSDLSTDDGRAAKIFQKGLKRMLSGSDKGISPLRSPETPVPECFGPFCFPPNKLIGLRSHTQHAKLSELAVLQMLNGGFPPQSGTASCTRKSELVGQMPVVFTGTLLENLTYSCHFGSARSNQTATASKEVPVEFDESGKLTPEADRYVWELCRKIGISPVLIGDDYEAGNGWGDQQLNAEMQALSVIDREDASKIEVVRALLARPDALLLHRVSDAWPVAEQKQLVHVLREYMSQGVGTRSPPHAVPPPPPAACASPPHVQKDATTRAACALTLAGAALAFSGRSVMLCTDDTALALSLRSDDLLLTIQSQSKMTLQTIVGSGITEQRIRMLQAWQEAMASELNRVPPSPLEAMGGSTHHKLKRALTSNSAVASASSRWPVSQPSEDAKI